MNWLELDNPLIGKTYVSSIQTGHNGHLKEIFIRSSMETPGQWVIFNGDGELGREVCSLEEAKELAAKLTSYGALMT